MGNCCKYSKDSQFQAYESTNKTYPSCDIIHPKPLYEWTREIENTLKTLIFTQYDFPSELFSLLLSFIDRKLKIPDPNSKIQYPMFIPHNILEHKLSLPSVQDGNRVNCNIVLLGRGGVGKTSITYRLIRNEFEYFYDPTIEETYLQTIHIDSNIVVMKIEDTSGQEEYPSLRNHVVNRPAVQFFVFSINDKSTFEAIDTYYKPYATRAGYDNDNDNENQLQARILVGNKCDLKQDVNSIQVSLEEAIDYAQKNDMLFVQTSAKDGGNVQLLFEIAVRYAAMLGKIKS